MAKFQYEAYFPSQDINTVCFKSLFDQLINYMENFRISADFVQANVVSSFFKWILMASVK